jgi:hypothetical protein
MSGYQLKITLKEVKPPVWRRVLVPSGISFSQLCVILLETMGWLGGHLYEFRFDKKGLSILHAIHEYNLAEAMFARAGSSKTMDANEACIDDFLKEGERFGFDYDFGDGWRHSVDVEKLLDDREVLCPEVLKYKGNCPPEDVGGPVGYENFLRIMSDKDCPEHGEMEEWAGSQCYCEYDIEETNNMLREMADTEYRDRAELFDEMFCNDEDVFLTDEEELLERGRDKLLDFVDSLNNMSDDEAVEFMKEPENVFRMVIIDKKPVRTLRTALWGTRMRFLRQFAERIGIESQQQMKKGELVGAIYGKLMDSNIFFGILPELCAEELLFVDDIMYSESKYIADEDHFPFELGLDLLLSFVISAYYDEYGNIVIVPIDEMKTKLAEFKEKMIDLFEHTLDDVDRCAIAATNLYGAISVDDFTKIFINIMDSEIDKETMINWLNDLISSYEDGDAGFIFRNGMLASDMLSKWTDSELKVFHDGVSTYPLNILPKEEFLCHEEWFFITETDECGKFVKFITEKLGNGKESADKAQRLAADICSLQRQSANMRECMDVISESGISFDSDEEILMAAEMLTDMHNNTRIWGLNGSTPRELGMAAALGMPYLRQSDKIGRNSPCPCGSGKKYKNCCGKAVLH